VPLFNYLVMWKKHPRALPYLFFSEMWERFGYYLMIGVFTLYLKDSLEKGGFNLNEAQSATLYGLFIALVYITPFLGGLLADRVIGYRRSIVIGGILMGIGYCTMGIPNYAGLYTGMALVIVGNGFFKPNISTLLGNIYSTPELKDRKDEGYNIFYMGVNLGAFICNFVAAVILNVWGWKYTFVSAGIGMFIGVLIFLAGNKEFVHADVRKPLQPGDMPLSRIVMMIILPAIAAGVLGWFIPGNILGKDSTDAFICACIPVFILYGTIYSRSNKEEKRPVGALLAIFVSVILFWAVFKQNGSALNTWANNYTERQVTGTTGDIFSALRLADSIKYTAKVRDSLDHHFRKITLAPAVAKQLADSFAAINSDPGKVKKFEKKMRDSVYQVVSHDKYFKNVPAADRPATGSGILVWSTNLSQSINPGWVIMLTPLVIAFFAWCKRRGREPSTPTKIAIGLFISALSVLVMLGAVSAGDNGAAKVSVWWLIGSYGVITIGELLLSPMGLSIVSKLSPVRITSLMMGGWMLAISIGNMLSGVLSSMWDGYENKASYFWLNFVLLLVATFILLLMLKWLNRVMKEKGVH
jgi:proton-dependent oligopeptide transporter, POT family